MSETKTARRNANDNYQHFNGTDHYYQYLLGYKLTDGAKQVAEDYQCYWFLDIIVSWQTNAQVRNEEFQVWKLSRNQRGSFEVRCEDGNNNLLIGQKITYSDFKDDDLTIWLQHKVIFLPSEY